MKTESNHQTLIQGFSKLNSHQRFQRLQQLGLLNETDIHFLTQGGLDTLSLGEQLIENVIGYFQLPLGVVPGFPVDGRDHVIPMAVEETSIVAGLSKMAKWIRPHGSVITTVEGQCAIGQLLIYRPNNIARLKAVIQTHHQQLIEDCNRQVMPRMVSRGGGVKDFQVREVSGMAIIHVHIDCVDAMGANAINQALEFLRTPICNLSDEHIDMCILSNLNDTKITKAELTLSLEDATLGEGLERASRFAEQDPYRAATHNKGVMNGIDPILIATGNDWRAVEAGVHAYACQQGQYRAITHWRYEAGKLQGQFAAPIVVGVVGGVTRSHPTARLAMRLLDVDSANHLSRICAAVGLVQNLAALVALTTEGITRGHMKLHIDNLILNTDASLDERPQLKATLETILEQTKRVSQNQVDEALQQLRQKQNTMV